MRLVLLFALALLPSTLAARAADDCGDGTQMEINQCEADRAGDADDRLNAAYAKVVRQLGDDAAGKAALKKAQRAWIAFRDAECDFRTSGSEQGTIYPAFYAGCLAEVTDARTADLEDVLACEEGDPGCGK
jgi:uncharacterized protein YecT (DUF1311 family)